MADHLVIFDFDNTLVDGNTDSLVLDMLPSLREASRNHKVEGKGWGEVMNSALETIGKNGLKKKDIDECILTLKITDTVESMLLNLIKDHRADVIIVSHSNEYFIDILLLDSGIDKSQFKRIFTFPAKWNDQGQLKVKRFHQEIISCKYCPNDFCKGYVVAKFIESMEEDESKVYSKRIYVGDGRADFCASKSLDKNDLVLCRYGFTLHKLILKHFENNDTSRSNIPFPKYTCWQSFDDLKEKLTSIMNGSL